MLLQVLERGNHFFFFRKFLSPLGIGEIEFLFIREQNLVESIQLTATLSLSGRGVLAFQVNRFGRLSIPLQIGKNLCPRDIILPW